jgi:phage regulator Rha-like protein
MSDLFDREAQTQSVGPATVSSFAGSSSPTMSSREIAELVSLRHDNVRRTIEVLADRGVIGLPQIEENPPGPAGGRPGITYVFSGEQGKRDSYVVVAQLSPEFTGRLVDRWQELERERAFAGLDLPLIFHPAAIRVSG